MSLDPWHDFFVATAGAGSALAGLIIVAMSANIRTILGIPSMTSRAATTIAVLVLIVVIACAGLVPDQSTRLFGIEVLLASAVATTLAVRSTKHILEGSAPGSQLGLTAAKAALGLVPTVVALGGGMLVSIDVESGLDVTAAGMIVGFATAVTNAWVLLVEVLR